MVKSRFFDFLVNRRDIIGFIKRRLELVVVVIERLAHCDFHATGELFERAFRKGGPVFDSHFLGDYFGRAVLEIGRNGCLAGRDSAKKRLIPPTLVIGAANNFFVIGFEDDVATLALIKNGIDGTHLIGVKIPEHHDFEADVRVDALAVWSRCRRQGLLGFRGRSIIARCNRAIGSRGVARVVACARAKQHRASKAEDYAFFVHSSLLKVSDY